VNPARHEPSWPAVPPVAETEIGWRQPEPEPLVEASRPRRVPLVLAGGAAVVAATVVGALIMTSGSPELDAPSAGASATRDIGAQDAGVPGANVPPGVPTITPQRLDAATVRFTWTYSAQLDSDTFAWRTRDGGPNGTTTAATVDVSAPVGSAMCLQVKVVRADGSNATTAWSPAGCSD
jgi:alkylhydroperoxidase family enzyme